MIRNIRHKGLRALFEAGKTSGVHPQHVKKLRVLLAVLNEAEGLVDIDQPTFSLHELSGKRAGTWAVTVRANWRLTFRFESGDVVDLDYEDYH